MEIKPLSRLKLYGFNNLTKSLSFNMYDICYAKSLDHRKSYIEYIDDQYNAERLTNIVTEVAHIIGANILNIANRDYDPQGASVTMLIAEESELLDHQNEKTDSNNNNSNEMLSPMPESVVARLDKSHITIHTYPESHPAQGISTFRADIDVSTCGQISPLTALNFLMKSFSPDIANVDYRVRGFTRDINGKKLFMDHKINSIQNYLSRENLELYQMIDVNVYQEKIFHTKMLLKDFDLDNYLFGSGKDEFNEEEIEMIKRLLKKEMNEIFYGKNLPKV